MLQCKTELNVPLDLFSSEISDHQQIYTMKRHLFAAKSSHAGLVDLAFERQQPFELCTAPEAGSRQAEGKPFKRDAQTGMIITPHSLC